MDLHETIDTHLTAYGEPDAATRAALVPRAWAPNGRLADPPLEARGHGELAGLGDVIAEHYPGHRFHRTTGVDEHHGFARYGWELRAPDGTVAVSGIDVVTVADDGRLELVVGFFGDSPPLEAAPHGPEA